MLLGNFFRIIERSGPEEELSPAGVPVRKFSYSLQSEQDHDVYKGHFPGNPVTPGVFQVQIIHELVSDATGHKLRLINAENVKYLSMMIPSLHSEFNATISIKNISETEYNVSAVLSGAQTVFIKFKGIFRNDDI